MTASESQVSLEQLEAVLCHLRSKLVAMERASGTAFNRRATDPDPDCELNGLRETIVIFEAQIAALSGKIEPMYFESELKSAGMDMPAGRFATTCSMFRDA